MTGKFEIMSEVREGLDNLEVTLRDGDRIWTKVVLTKLCEIGRGFRFHVCANKGKVDKANRDYGEWLYDVTWLKYDCNYRVIDVPLVAECEWGRLENIYDDFDKLLLARARPLDDLRRQLHTRFRENRRRACQEGQEVQRFPHRGCLAAGGPGKDW